MNAEHLSNEVLIQRVRARNGRQRELMVQQLQDLALVYRRRAHIEAGHQNFWRFLIDDLGMCKGTASRYFHATRIISQTYGIPELLTNGRLSLGTLLALRPALDVIIERQDLEGLRKILAEASGKNEEACAVIAVGYAPRPVTADTYRRVSVNQAFVLEPAATVAVAPAAAAAPTPVRIEPPSGRIEPVTAELKKLSITVGKDFDDDFMAVREALSHSIPDGDMVEVLHECIKAKLREVMKQRGGSGRMVSNKPSEALERYVPVAVRAEVWRRDAEVCTYVAADGRRCESRWMLQLDHVIPFALGGQARVENLRLRCRSHNLWRARQELGDEALDRPVQG